MNLIKIISFFLIFTPLISAQNISRWKNHSSMRDTKDITIFNNTLWAATNGGMFSHNLTTGQYKLFTKSEGLKTQNLTAIQKDNQNRVWTGSGDGAIHIYNPASDNFNYILDIFYSSKNQKQINEINFTGDTALVSSNFGLSVINTNSLLFAETILKFGTFLTESPTLSTFKDTVIYVVTDQGVGVQKSRNINLQAPESWRTYGFGTQINASIGSKITRYNGNIILATNNGVFELADTNWNNILLPGEDIIDILVDDNNLYLINSANLLRYNGTQVDTLFSIPADSRNITLYNNAIYISTPGGAVSYANSEPGIITPSAPYSNLYTNMTVDNKSNLWVASARGVFGVGFYKFDGLRWTNYAVWNTPVPSNAFHNVYAAPDNTIYLSNWGSGFSRIRNGVVDNFTTANTDLVGIPADTDYLVIFDIENDNRNNTWVLNYWPANNKPLSVLTPDNLWYHYTFPSPAIIGDEYVEHLVIDRNNTKWFAVTNGDKGLYYFNENNTFEDIDDDTYGYLTTANGLINADITSLTIDARGYIWIGTIQGINYITNPLNPRSSIRTPFASFINQQYINCITVDGLNNKWVGTKQGVFVLSSDGSSLLKEFNTANSPLPSDDIKSIAVDYKKGIVYIGTDYGLSSVFTDAAAPSSDSENMFVYPNPLFLENGTVSTLTISGLARNSSIKIITISGDLVADFPSAGGNVALWDGRDSNGNFVPSGIYIIIAYDDSGTNVGKTKAAVLRR